MTRFWRVVALGAASVTIFDGLASHASLFFGFPYAYASFGSFIIYAAVGFFACKGKGGTFWAGLLAAAFMGVVDSTIGWYVSWQIGPGALQGVELTPSVYLGTMVFVVGIASASGLLGAGVAKLAGGYD